MDNPKNQNLAWLKTNWFKPLKTVSTWREKFGIHSFLASNTLTNDYYPVLAKELLELAVEVVQMTDVDLDFINLSGGIGVNYKPDEVENDIAKIGDGVRQAYRSGADT